MTVTVFIAHPPLPLVRCSGLPQAAHAVDHVMDAAAARASMITTDVAPAAIWAVSPLFPVNAPNVI
ncbi:MAG: hypothetical protein PF483_10180, partial [Halothiobacillus sp.]|nr:hypothetical protein [Halothiobacillus sp.]